MKEHIAQHLDGVGAHSSRVDLENRPLDTSTVEPVGGRYKKKHSSYNFPTVRADERWKGPVGREKFPVSRDMNIKMDIVRGIQASC